MSAEARTVARLEHPHIVRLLDFDVAQDTPFLVMSYAPGGTLRKRHPRGSILPIETILTYLRQIADALQYAHDQKIIHRDLKPENVLIGQRGELLLSDFGIAILAHSSRSLMTQDVAGTVSYIAPEQLSGKPRRESDQYALATMIYEWLTGTLPFEGTSAEIIGQRLHANPPSLRKKVPSIPPALDEVILKALAREPKERFASVQEFAAAFERASLPRSQTTAFPTLVDSPLMIMNNSEQAATTPDLPLPASSSSAPTRHNLTRRTLLVGLPVLTGAIGLGAGVAIDRQITPQPAFNTTPGISTGQTHTSNPMLVVYNGHTDVVRAVAWSPNGKRLASSSDYLDKTVQVWDARTGAHPFVYRAYPTTISALAWSPDGTRIACGDGNIFFGNNAAVQVWEVASGTLLLNYTGHTLPINALAWSSDGTRIASASQDKTVRVWKPNDGTLITTYVGHSDIVNSVKWSPDNQLIASGSNDKSAQIWDAHIGTHLLSLAHNSAVNTVSWSPDGKRLATGSGSLFFGDEHLAQIWDARTGQSLLAYAAHTTAVSSLSWSPNGKRIVSASHDKTVRVWNPNNGSTLFTYSGHTLGITSVAWSPDGSLIATASLDGTVRVWQVP